MSLSKLAVSAFGFLILLGSYANGDHTQFSKSLIAPEQRVKVLRLEVDGRAVRKDFTVILYVGGQAIEPVRVEDGFIVPAEVKKSTDVGVRFLFGGYDLRFDQVYGSKFDTDWIIGVDTKPFSSEYVTVKEARNLKLVYYVQFVARDGDGTQMIVKVPKSARSATSTAPHDKALGPESWLNLPSSPLWIERSPNGSSAILSNHSLKTAIRYRLGCVVTTNEKMKTLREAKDVHISLAGRQQSSNTASFVPLDLTRADVNRCTNQASSVAVTKVVFADRSHWVIGSEPSSRLSLSTFFRPWRFIR